ncbi:MAG: NADH-quinone oxidoreductase subunit C, partial [Nitrososphaerota archaeon]|nr:NADH-quinone oxidoreductase subunit C [Nitrososphaerota archaeon]
MQKSNSGNICSEEFLAAVESKLKGKIPVQLGVLGRAVLTANSVTHRDVIKAMLAADEQTAIVAITGLDLGVNLGVYYHFSSKSGYYTVKVEIPKDNPHIETITDIVPGAVFAEMEGNDLFGIVFDNHPSPGRLVLSEDWPEGVYPLRKDVIANKVKLVPSKKAPEEIVDDNKTVKIIIGPQHPALIEPEKFSVSVEGEIVTKVEPRLGYVHRGVEKSAESRTYIQNVYLVERICGICNGPHAWSFSGAVEKILDITVPRRAQFIRVITLELNRIHSHLLVLGHAGLEIGYETLFQYFWRDREPIMDLIELTCGNRVYESIITMGGVRRDLNEADSSKIIGVLENLRTKIPFYKQLYENEPTIAARMKGVGVLKREDAISLGVVGPVARASGYAVDVRKDVPYEVYGEIPFKEIVYTEGDVWARMNVRMDEVEESINIIEYALNNLPKGAIKVD